MSERALKIEAPAIHQGPHGRIDEWLEAAALRGNADSAALFVVDGTTIKIASCYPEIRAVDLHMLTAARRAVRKRRVLFRIDDGNQAADNCSTAYIGLSATAYGKPVTIALKFAQQEQGDDDALLKKAAALVLRQEPNQDPKPPTDLATALEAEPKVGTSIKPAPATTELQPAEPPANDTTAELIRAQGAAINSLATVLDHSGINQSLHALADSVAQTWNCLRVTIGIIRKQRIAVAAVSGSAAFDPRSALLIDIRQALEETRSAAVTIALPAIGDSRLPSPCHAALANQLQNPALISVPLVDRNQIVGVVLLERDRPFSAEEQQQIERTTILLAPVIALKIIESLDPIAWFARFAARHMASLFGTKNLGWKLGLTALFFLITCSTFFTQEFRVDAEASIEASTSRAVVANVPSFLSVVERKAGDVVQQGDVLAVLDVEELELDRINWVGEFDKLSKEYRAVLAQRDRSDIRVIEARRAQAQSRIDLLDAQIERATLRAPIDGVVVSGDLSQALGSPVERGELLFEVASLDDYRLVVMVDETDIGWIEVGSEGNLRLRSLPNQSFRFTVSAITPVSEPGEGANRFRVEASAAALPTRLRPGMGGIAKIDVGPRAIGWVWTHSFVNWLRLQLWQFGL